MTINYSISKHYEIKNTKNLALFTNENFKILNSKALNLTNQNTIDDLIQNNKNQKNKILHLNLNKEQNLIIIKVKKNSRSLENEKLGAEFYDFVNSNSINNFAI